MLLGLLAAFWADSRDKRFHEPRDVERAYGVPTLLDLGHVRRRAVRNLVTSAAQPPPAFAELAEYVAAIPAQRSLVLAVGGGSPEGVSVVAANLAVALSRGRPGVFLVCAGADTTLVPGLLERPYRSGLGELLASTATIEEVALSPEGLPDLRVIGPGLEEGAALRHQNYDARRHFMDSLRSQARYAIVESPLTNGEPPVFTLAELTDGGIAVIETSRTKRADVDRWLRHLERVRVPALGTAVIPRLDHALRWRSRRAQVTHHPAAEEAGDTVPIRA